MRNMIKLSVIIPVYNIKDYLRQCIDSLICERSDYEILLVDDGSTDGSAVICDEYAAKHDLVKVFHKQNGGVSSARNLGLQKSEGEYIYFVDGDDWVEGFSSVLESLNGHENLYGVNFDAIDAHSNIVISHHPTCSSISVNDYSKYYVRHSHALWAFIFRKEKIEQLELRFCEDLKYAEDWVFVVDYLSHTLRINNLHGLTYKYRLSREGSAMNQKYDSRQIMLHFKAFDLINAVKPIQECKKYYRKERNECFSYVLNIVMANIDIINRHDVQCMVKKRVNRDMLASLNLKFFVKILMSFIKLGYEKK